MCANVPLNASLLATLLIDISYMIDVDIFINRLYLMLLLSSLFGKYLKRNEMR